MSQLYHQEAALACVASSEVEFGDGPLSAAFCALFDGTFAVVLHLRKIFVEHLARSKCRHQVVEFSILLAVLFGLPGFSFLLTLFLELFTDIFPLITIVRFPFVLMSVTVGVFSLLNGVVQYYRLHTAAYFCSMHTSFFLSIKGHILYPRPLNL